MKFIHVWDVRCIWIQATSEQDKIFTLFNNTWEVWDVVSLGFSYLLRTAPRTKQQVGEEKAWSVSGVPSVLCLLLHLQVPTMVINNNTNNSVHKDRCCGRTPCQERTANSRASGTSTRRPSPATTWPPSTLDTGSLKKIKTTTTIPVHHWQGHKADQSLDMNMMKWGQETLWWEPKAGWLCPLGGDQRTHKERKHHKQPR